jgi:hypothetical protein
LKSSNTICCAEALAQKAVMKTANGRAIEEVRDMM